MINLVLKYVQKHYVIYCARHCVNYIYMLSKDRCSLPIAIATVVAVIYEINNILLEKKNSKGIFAC